MRMVGHDPVCFTRWQTHSIACKSCSRLEVNITLPQRILEWYMEVTCWCNTLLTMSNPNLSFSILAKSNMSRRNGIDKQHIGTPLLVRTGGGVLLHSLLIASSRAHISTSQAGINLSWLRPVAQQQHIDRWAMDASPHGNSWATGHCARDAPRSPW